MTGHGKRRFFLRIYVVYYLQDIYLQVWLCQKTKLLSKNKDLENYKTGDQIIEIIKEYKYLGQKMAMQNKNRMDGEIQARIGNGWKAYWRHKHIFKSKMSIRAKTKILESSILPILTYDALIWALTKHQTSKLVKTPNSNILGIRLKDKIRNKEIRSRTNSTKIFYIIKKLKINYAGHLARENKDKWNRASTFWIPRDRKRKKRQTSH